MKKEYQFHPETALLAASSDANCYTLFRTSWRSETACEAILALAAEACAECFLNGERLWFDQPGDLPPEKSVTELKVTLCAGENVFACRVHTLGIDHFSHIASASGIIAEFRAGVRLLESSGRHWKTLADPAFSPDTPRVNRQMGFTFCFDARRQADWMNPQFDDSRWMDATECPDAGYRYIPRVLAPEHVAAARPARLSAQGVLLRRSSNSLSVAQQCMSDWCAPVPVYEWTTLGPDPTTSQDAPVWIGDEHETLGIRKHGGGADGIYLIADLGCETVGLLDFALEARDGVVVDIAHGEHLTDGRVRAAIGERNFADRYICRAGTNEFIYPFRRLGARYLELHLTGDGVWDTRIRRVTLRRCSPQLSGEQPFSCSDRMLDKLYRTACDTLTLCMHEHYEDCPWREQGLYAYDSRNQALFGYMARGNGAFARHSLDLLGRNRFTDGMLHLTAPGRYTKSIPVFSFAWIAALEEYRMHTGDESLAREHESTIRWILDSALARFDGGAKLCRLTGVPEAWHFYEWVRGLEGDDHTDFSALYNLYLYEALRAAERLSGDVRYGEFAKVIGRAVETRFWDESRGCYRSGDGVEYLHEHMQSLMLFHNLIPDAKRARVLACLREKRLQPITFSALPYLLRAYAGLPECADWIQTVIRSEYEPMLLNGATSFWESSNGSVDFRGAGSLCHGWSAFAAYYCKAMVLGIRPLEPGYRRFRVKPLAGSLDHARGAVPTPFGLIEAAWRRNGERIELALDHPPELQAEIAPGIDRVNMFQ